MATAFNPFASPGSPSYLEAIVDDDKSSAILLTMIPATDNNRIIIPGEGSFRQWSYTDFKSDVQPDARKIYDLLASIIAQDSATSPSISIIRNDTRGDITFSSTSTDQAGIKGFLDNILQAGDDISIGCLLYTSPSPRD